MGTIRFMASSVALLAMLVLAARPTGADPGTRAGESSPSGSAVQVHPELDREALWQCVADERESRALLERYQQESEAVAAAGRRLDARRRELAALRASVDPRDAAAVDRYNARATEFDARVQHDNAGLASLAASRRAQQTVARRYNTRCGGRHYLPNALRPIPEPAK